MLKETNKSSEAEGADMFFPTIIYCLLKGCPRQIKAHVEFIKLYRNPQLLDSEDDYFLTTITSALDFIGCMECDDLNIKESDYRRLYDKHAKKNGIEVDQRIQRRKAQKNERHYDDMDNQSEMS